LSGQILSRKFECMVLFGGSKSEDRSIHLGRKFTASLG